MADSSLNQFSAQEVDIPLLAKYSELYFYFGLGYQYFQHNVDEGFFAGSFADYFSPEEDGVANHLYTRYTEPSVCCLEDHQALSFQHVAEGDLEKL